MAGHSKRHNIRHKKAATDAKKSKVYSRISKIITLAAKNWSDPGMNPSLATALDKARYNSLPKDVIQKAIEKWAGGWEWQSMVEIFYEWYGPWWSALYIKCLTDNTNRSASSVRSTIAKLWGNIWEPWSVSWQFVEKWVIYISWISKKSIIKWNEVEEILLFDNDKLEEDLMELDLEDYAMDDWVCKVTTSKTAYISVVKQIESLWYKIDEADLRFESTSPADISDEDANKLERIIEALEEDDDVDTVYNNVF